MKNTLRTWPRLWTHWNPLEYSQLPRHAFFCWFSSPSHSSLFSNVRILSHLPHFARWASRKIELQKNHLSALSSLRITRVLWRFARKLYLSLSCQGTQLRAFVGEVCLLIFLRAVFWNIFSLEADTWKSYNSKGIYSISLKIWTVAILTYKQQKHISLNIFFKTLFQKEKTELEKNKVRFWFGVFKRWLHSLHLVVVKENRQFILFPNSRYSLIAGSENFNLI